MSELPSIRKICGIIDFAGSYVRSEFFVREIGLISSNRNSRKPIGKFFDFRPYATDMFLPRSRSQLPPQLPQFHDIITLDSHLLHFWHSVKSENRNIIGYKGGQCERDRLESLQIPSVNLELYGCPAYDTMRSRENTKLGCKYHRTKRAHCPRSEVAAFKTWLLHKQMQENA